ncbi:proline-rich protein PRCC-like [Saccostrea echinata]|uniref:proline-rich protein PRCC-like n=1 Tax=Saccostrea echinata TaxID=191078 RepID=UPI002A830BAE|nr:proline-rich protein PRCC-like [Saccostrea echinata]
MSLVAYGDSDESDIEEGTGEEHHVKSLQEDVRLTKKEEISDSESDNETRNEDDDLFHDKLKALPEPKHIPAFKGLAEIDELEDEVKPRPAELADAPKPPRKKPRQPVRITIPSIPDPDDDEGPCKKRSKTSNSCKNKSGLFAVLPPPIHATIKEKNRALIPHTLTKKQVPQAIHVKSSSSPKEAVGPPKPDQHDSDSEGEDQPSSFFSLGSDDNRKTLVSGFSLKKMSLPPPVSANANESQNFISGASRPTVNVTLNNGEPSLFSGSTDPQYAPIQFKESAQNVFHSSFSEPISMDTSTTEQFDERFIESERQKGPTVLNGEEEFQQLLQSDEFLRMQGKKQRGKEAINIVDVNAGDFISTVDVTKSLTEEQPTHLSHKKGEGPTSNQKRKHQITYLAHQAKEREIELKNEWSQNRLTRRQTQAKYGF